MTRYGVSFWLGGPGTPRPPAWPRASGDIRAEIAIVGGGLTGCAAAYLLAAAGRKVALFEGGRVGRGATGAADGVLAIEPWPLWYELEVEFGRRNARLARDAYRRAALDFAAALRRLGVRCELEQQPATALAAGEEGAAMLERDQAARREAGLDASWLGGKRLQKELGVESGSALATASALTLDPYRACLGLAKAAADRGCLVFEASPVLTSRPGKGGMSLRLPSGSARATTVIFATVAPPPAAPGLARHFRRSTAHHVATPPLPATMRRQLGARPSIIRVVDGTPRRVRWTRDHRLIFSEGGLPPVDKRSRERSLVQRTGRLMYELSLIYPAISGVQPDFGWDAEGAETGDALPLVGTHRNYPGCLFALGTDRAGVASAWLSARVLGRQITGRPDKGDELFGFQRTRGQG